MPEFVMPLGDSREAVQAFHKLDPTVRGYIECMFWTECNADSPELEHKTFEDLAPETLAQIIDDCATFEQIAEKYLQGEAEFEQIGHDFWLTRNRHGAGFWDRPKSFYGGEANGRELTELAHSFGERYLYVGDDEKLYLS